jgi:hypothetical protein
MPRSAITRDAEYLAERIRSFSHAAQAVDEPA